MTRITITLSDEERKALRALAAKEFREPRGQAALIIRRELERQGLIEAANQDLTPAPSTLRAESQAAHP